MKKIIMILLIASLVLSIGPVLAQPTTGFPMESKVLTADTNLAVAAGKEIYGYTLWVTTAAGNFGLHDSATLAGAAAADAIVEDSEATDEESATVWFPKPLVTDKGCSVKVNTAIVTLYYQK